MFSRTLPGVIWALASLPLAAQNTPVFSRDFCLKVNAGKQADYAALLPDAAKMNQVRVNEGRLLRWMALGAVVPLGTAARCDYHIILTYSGFPSELPTVQETGADLERAHVKMTGQQFTARRDADTTIAGLDIWQRVEAVGQMPRKGNYLQINYYQPKPGKYDDWVKLETSGWKPFAEHVAKEMPGTGWLVAGLVMPAGDRLHYTGMTVDVYPSWEAMGKGIPYQEMWPKVHSDMSMNDFMSKLDDARGVYSREVFQVVELASK